MKYGIHKLLALVLVVALLIVAVPSTFVATADTAEKITVNLPPQVLNNATNGIDTFKDMSLMSDYAGHQGHYSLGNIVADQDPNGAEMLFLAQQLYNEILTGMDYNTEDYRQFFGTAGPWFAWNVNGGSTITFLGRLSKSLLYQNLDTYINNENQFKFQYLVNGSSQGWMTVTSGVELTRISSQADIDALKDTIPGIDNEFRGAVGSTRRNNDFTNYAFVLSSFTLPEDACAVRVIFPRITTIMKNVDYNYFASGLMMRATGGQEAAPTAFTVDTALTGSAITDLNNAAVAGHLGVGAYGGTLARAGAAPAAGQAASTPAYVTYEVKGSSPFVLKAQLSPYARRFSLKFELSWSSDNQNFEPLYPRYSYVYNTSSQKYIMTAALADLPNNARYIRATNPVNYNNLGMTIPGNPNKTYQYSYWNEIGIIGAYFNAVDHTKKPVVQGATISTDGGAKLRFLTANLNGLPAGATVVSYGTLMMPNQLMDPNKATYKADAALVLGNPYCAVAQAESDSLPETWAARLSNSESYLGVKIAARSFVEYSLDGGVTTQVLYGNVQVRAVYSISYDMVKAIVGKKDEISAAGVTIAWTETVPQTTEVSAVDGIAAADVHNFVLANEAALTYYVKNYQ